MYNLLYVDYIIVISFKIVNEITENICDGGSLDNHLSGVILDLKGE